MNFRQISKHLNNITKMNNQQNTEAFNRTSGRLIVVDGIRYKWVCGRAMVKCRCELGYTFIQTAAHIKGVSPEAWQNGQREGSTDGALTPQDITDWIRAEEKARKVAKRLTCRIQKNVEREKRNRPLFG